MSELKLHNFFRSSTSTRVRIALNLKGLRYDYVPYVLRAGETRTPEYLARNPAGLVPTLELQDGVHLNQSLSIIEWLEETYPAPALLPADPIQKAQCRSLAMMMACEIHPLNNLRVLFRLRDQFGADETAQKEWFTHWVMTTFDALEIALGEAGSAFAMADKPGLVDICLYAQVLNNQRFDIPVETWPRIAAIFAALDEIEAFTAAAPACQPDAAERGPQ